MPAKKRSVPETPNAPGRRRSTRASSSNQKSRYFESDSDDADDVDERGDGPADKLKVSSGKKRGRPAKKPTATQRKSTGKRAKIEHNDDDDNDDDDADDFKEDLEDEEDEDDDDNDSDEDKMPQVTIIPLIKMRATGGVDYEDDRLHKNTLLFLKDLKANNVRDWLKSNDEEYRRSLQDWNSYVESLSEKVMATDPTIPELPLKDIIFRIYRDIRFSKDPTPYKPHYSVAFSRTGRKGPYACYYLHCEPGSSIVGGGLWQPDAQAVAKLRASIDERPRRWRRALMDEEFRNTFYPTAKSGDEKSCLKAFAKANEGNALKTKPKGFDATHRDIDLLKLRNFTVWKKIPDSIFTAEDGQEQITGIISAMVGFVTFLNDVVMPDPDMDSDSSSEDEDEDEDGEENGEEDEDEDDD